MKKHCHIEILHYFSNTIMHYHPKNLLLIKILPFKATYLGFRKVGISTPIAGCEKDNMKISNAFFHEGRFYVA